MWVLWCTCQKEREKERKGEGRMVTPGKLGVLLGNVKAIENPFPLGTINEEERKIPQEAIPVSTISKLGD